MLYRWLISSSYSFLLSELFFSDLTASPCFSVKLCLLFDLPSVYTASTLLPNCLASLRTVSILIRIYCLHKGVIRLCNLHKMMQYLRSYNI